MTLQLGYFNSRGYAHPIRQLLFITNQPFENITFKTLQEWQTQKAEILGKDPKTPFVNLPYLVDEDFFLTESSAIPDYICHKVNRGELLGKGLKDQARVREVLGLAKDLLDSIVNLLFGEGRAEKIKESAGEGGKCRILYKKISAYLAEKEFLLGYFTYADLVVSHYVRYARNYCLSFDAEDPCRRLGNLIEFCKRVDGLPELEGFPYDLPYVPEGMIPWFKEFALPQ